MQKDCSDSSLSFFCEALTCEKQNSHRFDQRTHTHTLKHLRLIVCIAPSQSHFLPSVTLTSKTKQNKKTVAVLSISIYPKSWNMLSSVQRTPVDRRASELKASPIFAGTRGEQCGPLWPPVCIYEWLSLGAKPQNNAATLKGWFSYGRGDGDDGGSSGGDGGGEGGLFHTVGAWYREWREVLLAAGWCDASHVSVRGTAAGAAHTGAAGGRPRSPTQVSSSTLSLISKVFLDFGAFGIGDFLEERGKRT